jgi:hypothetical protein
MSTTMNPIRSGPSAAMTKPAYRQRESGTTCRALAALGCLAAILTIVGLSGVGDAPAPLVEARLMAEHFRAVRADVFVGAVIGLVGVAALVGFGLALAVRLGRTGERAAALAVSAGLAVVAGYLLATHVVYTTLSYAVAATSDDITKGMFVATILAVPVFALGVATLLFAAAIGSWRAGIMPRWWRIATFAAGTLSSAAVSSYADSGFFSPDVQQQVIAYVLVVWLAATSIVWATRPPRAAPASGLA